MSTVEDSYDGALQRLRALGHEPPPPPARVRVRVPPPPIALKPPKADAEPPAARMRELKALAQLACDENERLEAQLAEAREENRVLQRRLTMLEETIADPRGVLGLPTLPVSLHDERPASVERGGNPVAVALVFGLAVAIVGGALYARTQLADRHTAMAVATVVASARDAIGPLVTRATSFHPRYGRADIDLARTAVVAVPPPIAASPPAAPVVAAPVAAKPAPVAAKPASVATRPTPHPARPAKKIGRGLPRPPRAAGPEL